MNRILPNWIDGFLEMTEGMDIPPLYAEWTAISSIAAALQRKCWTYAGRHYQHPGLYIILVGPTRCGKGTAMGQSIALIDGHDEIALSTSSLGGLGLYKCLVNSTHGTTLSKPYIINRTERTELRHSSLYAHIEEFRNFVGYGDYGMVEKLCDLYDIKKEDFSHTSLTGEDVDIPAPCLNILAGTVQEAFRDPKMLKAMTFDGLGSRCVLVYGDYTGNPAVWDERSPKQERLVSDLRHDIEFFLMLNGPFEWTKEAIAYYLKWQDEWKKNPLRLGKEYQGFIIGGRVHMARLSMPICAARREGSQIITVKDLEQVNDLLIRTCVEMPKVYEQFGENRNFAVMMDMVEYLKYHGATERTKLRAEFVDRVDKRNFEKIVEDMEDFKYVKAQKDVEKGDRFIVFNENRR